MTPRATSAAPSEARSHRRHARFRLPTSWWLAAVALLLVAAPSPSGAAEVADDRPAAPPSWGELTPGPHAVGFRVAFTRDDSRAYRPARDYRGVPNPDPTGRPLQVSIWYPATPRPGAAPLAFGDYVELQATALGPEHAAELRPEALREVRDELMAPHFPPDGPGDDDMAAVLAQPMAAFRDAPAAAGSFPLVIHSGFGPFAQAVLLEYLASHGYVVVTTHMLGHSPAWFHRGADSLEWWLEEARDVSFLRAFGGTLKTADAGRAAVVGMTAAAGLLAQMDSMDLEALVGWEASYPDLLMQAPGFELARARIPILDLVSSGRGSTDPMLERLAFADRWRVRFPAEGPLAVAHVDFYPFQSLAGARQALEHRGYATAARLTLRFLDAVLKGAEPAAGESWAAAARAVVPDTGWSFDHLPAEAPIPTEDELLLLVREGRSEEAGRAYRDAAERGHGRFFDPDALRVVSMFRHFDDGDPRGAAGGLEILVDAYPDDVEGWRRLGLARQAVGDVAGARQALERALEVVAEADLPDDQRQRLRQRVEASLERLPDAG